ncbi:MAG TPA: ABC transporter ATP-binding protein [Burkholderiales bacterium]|jgi:branched-chain amino acid transport system ATP-binding protein|nr:ABC transporter ATP-binding protein [Burkholderiales bacterium]
MADAALELKSLSLAFGGLQVLQDISFEARAGELLALIGPNGAGKTSVLNCICGLYRPAAGEILFGGRAITRDRPHAIARAGVARTFQHGELFSGMTVVENLLVARHSRLGTGLLGESLFLPSVRAAESIHRRRVEEILDFADLERYRHHAVDTLPFGMQKIVGFARALAMEPRVLLLDEPSAGLNRDEREDLARYLLRVRHELGIPMVWVEHDMQMVADLADRVCVLNHGRQLAQGTPAAVLRDPLVVDAYLGKA